MSEAVPPLVSSVELVEEPEAPAVVADPTLEAPVADVPDVTPDPDEVPPTDVLAASAPAVVADPTLEPPVADVPESAPTPEELPPTDVPPLEGAEAPVVESDPAAWPCCVDSSVVSAGPPAGTESRLRGSG